jgi:chromosome segregation ATPase
MKDAKTDWLRNCLFAVLFVATGLLGYVAYRSELRATQLELASRESETQSKELKSEILALAELVSVEDKKVKAAISKLQSDSQTIPEVSARLEKSEKSFDGARADHRELLKQMAHLRVALQQYAQIRIDSNGAVAERLGQKTNGITIR